MKDVADKRCRENQNTFRVQYSPPPKIVPLMR